MRVCLVNEEGGVKGLLGAPYNLGWGGVGSRCRVANARAVSAYGAPDLHRKKGFIKLVQDLQLGAGISFVVKNAIVTPFLQNI